MSEQTIDLKKIRIEDLDQVQHAEYATKALKKAARYMKFFNELDTGMEVSSNIILDIERMQRALRHRLEVLQKTAA